MPLETYDPNIRWGNHTVEVDFQCWEYKTTKIVDVGGNCRGVDVMRTAIGSIYDDLPGEEAAEIVLYSDDGATLLMVDDDFRCEDFLKDLVVGIRFVNHQKEGN